MSLSEDLLTEINSYIEHVRLAWNNVGVAVAIVREDELIYARGFGVREFGRTAKIDADTLFQVGSTSKSFTAAAVGVLVDEGKVQWDDPVADYLPRFRLQDPWLTRNITIRDTLAHRTGLIGKPHYYTFDVMAANEAIDLLRNATVEARFRDSFCYSNLMYAVAGRVIEVASGMSWHEFVRRCLLEPLNMRRSGTSPYEFWDRSRITGTYMGSVPAGRSTLDDARDANVAMPHGWDEAGATVVLPWQSYDNAAAAGAIVSSAADMGRWLLLHLNRGRIEDRQILSERTLRELHSSQNSRIEFKDFPFELAGHSYAMGWHRVTHQGHVSLFHGGGIIGFPAEVMFLPEQRLGVAVLSNGRASMRDGDFLSLNRSIELGVIDRLLEGPMRDWKEEFIAQSRNERNRQADDELNERRLRNTSPSLPLSGYIGCYADLTGLSGKVTVSMDSGSLKLSFQGEGAFAARLEHWHHDLFRIHASAAHEDVIARESIEALFVSFVLDLNGKVVSFSALGSLFQRVACSDK